ncbi:MAG: hypothetical protein U0T69_01435 [Chitinophagales bacterium]
MQQLSAFKTARVFGIALLVCAGVLMFINPKPENNLPTGFYTPIIAFEFIQSKQEILNFFKVANEASYESNMLLGNYIDYVFMVLYSCFLLYIAVGIKKITHTKTMYLAMFFCMTMLIADAMENYQIYQLVVKRNVDFNQINPISSFNLYEVYLSLLSLFTWLKWSSIASTFLLFSPFFFNGKTFHKIIGVFCVACFGLCIAAFMQHGILNEIFATSVIVVFLLLIIFVFTYKEVRE